MKPFLFMALALPLAAQTPAAGQAASAPVAAPAQTAAAAAQPAAPAESSVPSGTEWLTGWFEAGYRWDTGPGGSLETYRSVVDLGSGPKLLGADFTITDPRKLLFDTIHVEAHDWSDPYSTLRVDAEKKNVYRLTASYRSLAYFNNLPSYADPLLQQGIVLNEQSFDARRHIGSLEMHFLPERRISPYLGFDHDGNTGRGITTFQTGDNEFAVPYTNTDIENQYRGGVNIALARLHLTLEEGGTTWRSNENAYSNGPSPGNSSVPVLGQTLDLTTLSQAWGIRGSSEYSRAVLTANPYSWIDIYAQFGYADPHNNVNYTQTDTGNLLLLDQVLFYSGEEYLTTAAARMPHTTGDVGWEIRPFKRLRIDQHWLTDRTHDAGSAAETDTLIANTLASPSALPVTVLPAGFNSFLASNYNEAETGVGADVAKGVRVRLAYRYVWGSADDLVLPQTGLLTIQNSALRRNVVLGSASWRMNQRFLASSDFEWGASGSEYFRTSLYNYRKVRMSGRYDFSSAFHLNADYRILTNRNPLAGSPYKDLSHQESLGLQWTPATKGTSVDVVYEHCGDHMEIDYLDPEYLTPTLSEYREYCHDISATASFALPAALHRAKVTAGGSALLTSGSRPTTYYQPVVRISLPVTKNLGWFAIWQYYGFGESYYAYENFQTNLFTTGLRFSR